MKNRQMSHEPIGQALLKQRAERARRANPKVTLAAIASRPNRFVGAYRLSGSVDN
jgi:hypothetical protein